MKKFYTLLIIFVLCGSQVFSQRLIVYPPDISDYPTVRADFFLYNSDDKRITDLDKNDFKVYEDNQPQKITFLDCPHSGGKTPISSVLTIDASGSMAGKHITMAKAAARTWIANLPRDGSECAITSFNVLSEVRADFTFFKPVLYEAVDSIKADNATNYNGGFMQPNTGAISVASKGKNKRVIVFLTDGQASGETGKIIQKARNIDCAIFSVVIGNNISKMLKEVSIQTGGMYFDNVNNESVLTDIYKYIQEIARDLSPCKIEWLSESCLPTRTSTIIHQESGKMSNVTYEVSTDKLPYLSFSSNASLEFSGTELGSYEEKQIIITANVRPIEVYDIKSDNANFIITDHGGSPPEFEILPGESRTFTVRFTPVDSSVQYGKFTLVSNSCGKKDFHVYADYNDPYAERALKLIHPNGGETFIAGNDTVIKWEGISKNDTVSVSYSTNNGKTWLKLADKAAGYNYNWKKIPKVNSDSCLAKIRENKEYQSWTNIIGNNYFESIEGFDIDKDNNSFITGGYRFSLGFGNGKWILSPDSGSTYLAKFNSEGSCLWANNMDGPNIEIPVGVHVDKEGNSYVWGRTYDNMKLNDKNVISGNYLYLIKFSPAGDLIWHQTINDPWNNSISDVTTDNSGNVYITGYFKFNIKFADDFELIPSQNTDFTGYTAKYDKDGKFIDAVTLDYYDKNMKIRITPGENLILSWQENIIKLDSMLNKQWDYRIENPNFPESFGDVELDNTGNIFAAALTKVDSGKYINHLLKLSRNGDLIRNDTTPHFQIIYIDRIGNLYALANINDSLDMEFDPSIDTTGEYILKFNSLLEFQNAIYFGDNSPLEMYADDLNQIYIAGEFTKTDFGTGNTITSEGESDVFLKKLSDIQTQEDISDEVWSIVYPVVKTHAVDMGTVVEDDKKDSTVNDFIINTSNYPVILDSLSITGTDTQAFSIVSDIKDYRIEPHDSVKVTFCFNPKTVGGKIADIDIHLNTETKKERIYGTAIKRHIGTAADLLDFGMVKVGEQKDIKDTLIKSISNQTIRIDSTVMLGPDKTQFEIIDGGGSFNLKPGEIREVEVRFAPKRQGRTSGKIAFYYNGPGSPATAALYGEGIKDDVVFKITEPSFEHLICESETTDTLNISNTGQEKLIIYDADFNGPEEASFSFVNNFVQTEIQAGKSHAFRIKFEPIKLGANSATISLQTNSPDRIQFIDIYGTKDSVGFDTDIEEFDLGYTCPDEYYNKTIKIINTGSLQNEIEITLPEAINSSESLINLSVGDTIDQDLEFEFTEIGIIGKKIILTDTRCGYSKEISVIGEVILPDISSHNLDINAEIGKYSDKELRIYNSSKMHVEIMEPDIQRNEFSFPDDPFPLRIPPDSFQTITLRFAPNSKGTITENVELTGFPCSDTVEILLTGYSKDLNIHSIISLPDTNAQIGEIDFELPLKALVEMNDAVEREITFDAEIRFNSNAFLPKLPDAGYIESKERVVNFTDKQVTLRNGTILLGSITGVVLHSDNFNNELKITNFEWSDTTIETEINNGWLKQEACVFDLSKMEVFQRAEMSVSPNPADGSTEIEIITGEKGNYELIISSLDGKKCYSESWRLEPGSTVVLRKQIDLSTLSDGSYIITLRTPLKVMSKPLYKFE